MSAVGMLSGHEIRRRWRDTIAVALLIGVVGALVMATAAGARRADTSLERFNQESLSGDIEISIGAPTAAQLGEFRRTKGIAAVGHLRAYAFAAPSEILEELAIAAPLDGVMSRDVDRARLVAGRLADPDAADEVTIGDSISQALKLRIGDELTQGTYTRKQIANAFSGGNPGPPAGPDITLRIVGIVRRPLDLGVRAAAGGVVVLTPAFQQKYDRTIGAYTDVLRVRTDHGTPGEVGRAIDAARRLFGDSDTFGTQSLGIETEGARNAIDVLASALWIIAAVTALAGLVAIAIVLTRDIAQIEHDQRTLRALGLTRRQRMGLYAPRALLIAGGGALIAGIGAVVLSPLFPIGLARQAEPDPGLHADWTVFAIAIPLVVAVVLGIAFVAALRATRRDVFDRPSTTYRRTSAIVEGFAALGLRPTATNGLRMAIQSGRGEAAVPLRSAFVGAVFGVAGVTAALVFAASLTHLTGTPRLYGWSFGLRTMVETTHPCVTTPDYGLAKQAGIGDIAAVCNATLELDGRPVNAWGFRSLRGTIDPVIVAGRAPRGDREVALGSVTLNALHKQIGDTVKAVGEGGRGAYRVVGRAVFPTFGSPQPLADGAAFTGAGLAPLREAGANETDYLAARLKPGADRDAIRTRLERVKQTFDGEEVPRFAFISGPSTPVEVKRLQQIDQIPTTIASLLGVLALLAVAHAMVTSVRRRRGELALLKVLGFDRGEVRATVAWQATVLGAVGLVLGLPIGLIIGRLVWRIVADGLGISTEVTTPALWLLLSVPIVLALVNLIAFFPARSASRTRPAVALRST